MRHKYIKVPDTNVELFINPSGETYWFDKNGTFTVPAKFKIKNISTGKIHVVERIVLNSGWKANVLYQLICSAEVKTEGYVLTEEPVTCKVCKRRE